MIAAVATLVEITIDVIAAPLPDTLSVGLAGVHEKWPGSEPHATVKLPVYPPAGVTLSVAIPDPPRASVSEFGATEALKLGATITSTRAGDVELT